MRVKRNSQAGFSLVESFLIILLLVGLGYTVYHFGWGTTGQARITASEGDIRTMEQAVGAYILRSNGQYPTADSKVPEPGKYKLIIWNAEFTAQGIKYVFYPDFIKRLPKHWNEGVWRIDSSGKVSVSPSP